MALPMRHQKTQHIPKSQPQKTWEEIRDGDPAKVLGGYVPQNIIQRITMPLESIKLFPDIPTDRFRTQRFPRL